MKRIKDASSAIWSFLDGYKTYIGALVIFVAWGLFGLHKIDEETRNQLVILGGAISVYGLRHALKK